MKCPYCGNELDLNTRFCTKCGKNVEDEVKAEIEEKTIQTEKENNENKLLTIWLVALVSLIVTILSFLGGFILTLVSSAIWNKNYNIAIYDTSRVFYIINILADILVVVLCVVAITLIKDKKYKYKYFYLSIAPIVLFFLAILIMCLI